MKLPISFGNRLFFRIVLPGSVLAFAVSRFYSNMIDASSLDLNTTVLFTLATLFFGTIFFILDMPIYMLFEGRRFWPKLLLIWGLKRQRARLLKLHRAMRRSDLESRNSVGRLARTNADRAYLEAAVDISGFPLDSRTSMPRASWPTRLGNLIASYEQYPRIKYGLDPVFFWPRLWVSIAKELREEIDNQQSLADGLLYLTAATTAASILFLIYASFGIVFPSHTRLNDLVWLDLSWSILFAVVSYVVYRISLYSHVQFGEHFKAVFDQYRCLLKFDDVLDLISNATNDPGLRSRSFNDQNIAVWRLLRWHRVRLPGRDMNQRVRLP